MKHELGRRPVILLALGLISGLVSVEHPVLALGSIALLWAAQGLVWRLAVVAALVGGAILSPPTAVRFAGLRPFLGEASVVDVPSVSSSGQVCEIRSQGLVFSLLAPREPILSPGDLVKVSGDAWPFPERLRDVSSLRLISGTVKASKGGIVVLRQGPAPYRWAVLWRSRFMEFVRKTTDPHAAAAIDALCFNATADLDDETYANLQRSGTVHIISASGLHVFIFALGLSAVLSLFPIPRGWRLFVIFTVLCLYAVGAGMRPPVVRSVAMAAILGGATLIRREPDLLSALGLTDVGSLLWRPIAVYDIGFQLSFVTVGALGMFLSYPNRSPVSPLKGLASGVIEVSKASFVATLASAPLTAYYFGYVSVVSIPANILIALSLPAITLTAFAALPLFGLLPALSVGLMVGIVQPLSGWVLWVVQSFGSLSFAAFQVPTFSPWWIAPYYAFCLLLWRPRARPV